MQSFARERVEALGEIDGYVLKKNSPSCGLERIRVYRDGTVTVYDLSNPAHAGTRLRPNDLIEVPAKPWIER